MTALDLFLPRSPAGTSHWTRLRCMVAGTAVALATTLIAACGGGDADPPPPPEDGGVVVIVAPTITEQPADATVGNGQPASFSVAASGSVPLAYQWRRNGAELAGATAATYSVAAAALADSSAAFSVVVSNAAGSVTSRNAVLTVTAAAPVLTVTTQPAGTTVAAGSSATFTVAATCSAGTLGVQWQRGANGSFADIAGATAATYTLTTAAADNGAQFRARLTCGGQAPTTSAVAALGVGTTQTVTLAALPVNGLRTEADIGGLADIVGNADGSWTLVQSTRVKRLRADLAGIDPVVASASGTHTDGPAGTAAFDGLLRGTRDSAGNLYFTQIGGAIRRMAPDGTFSTIVPPNNLTLSVPTGIAFGPDGDLYVSDQNTARIYRVTLAGAISTYAGNGFGMFADGPAATASFLRPSGLAFAANGDLYVADRDNHRIRRILRAGNGAGNVETVAGDGTAAVLNFPEAMVLRGTTLGVRDRSTLKEVQTTTGAVTTLAGGTGLGYGDGTGADARFPVGVPGIAGAPDGGYVVTEFISGPLYVVRTVSAAGEVRTIAQTNVVFRAQDGTGMLNQRPLSLGSLAVDGSSRVVSAGAYEVRRVDTTGAVAGVAGLRFAYGPLADGDGRTATFGVIGSIAAAGDVLYIAEDYRIRRIAADGTTSFVAGSTAESGFVNGSATVARFGGSLRLAIGPGGDVFVADPGASAVRRIDAAGNVSTYTTVPGPGQIAFAADGTLYVVSNGSLLRRSADLAQTTTLAGPGVVAMTVEPGGTAYYTTANGLYSVTPGSTPQLLIPITPGVAPVLGSANPSLSGVATQGLKFRAPKQLVVLDVSGALLLVTLP